MSHLPAGTWVKSAVKFCDSSLDKSFELGRLNPLKPVLRNRPGLIAELESTNGGTLNSCSKNWL